jgi:putative endonuclease
MDRRALGQAGERFAAAHLEHKGHEILRRNVYSAQGEIDLITRAPDGTIVFVEVRTRRGAVAASQAAASLDERKQRRMYELAVNCLAEHAPEADARIDVVTVALSAEGVLSGLTHYENAVQG